VKLRPHVSQEVAFWICFVTFSNRNSGPGTLDWAPFLEPLTRDSGLCLRNSGPGTRDPGHLFTQKKEVNEI